MSGNRACGVSPDDAEEAELREDGRQNGLYRGVQRG